MKYTIVLFLTIATLMGIFSFLRCKKSFSPHTETLSYPPFRIEKNTITDRRWKPNEGHVSKHRQTKYKVFYHDERITFPEELDANTGVPGIWKVYFLEDAPTPTLLVGSKQVYLVNEKDEAVNLIPIPANYSNYASVQWLDTQDSQPGPKTEILVGEDTTNCILTDGQHLLINETSVLRIKDLKLFHFTPNRDHTDDYSTYQVLGFSPDKREIAFMGSKSHEIHRTEFVQGIVVYNIEGKRAYTLPVDKTNTRLHDPYSAGAEWFNTYLEWKQDTNGRFIVNLKTLPELPAWTGHFTKSANYQLSPVREEMHAVFLAFVKTHLSLSEDEIQTDEYNGLIDFRITFSGFVLNIGYQKDFRSVSFSVSFMNKGPEEEAKKLIAEVGETFNTKLSTGEYQDLFTSYDLPQTSHE